MRYYLNQNESHEALGVLTQDNGRGMGRGRFEGKIIQIS